MSDPINEIFNGTPDGIDAEELQQMQAAEQQRLQEIQTMQQELTEEGPKQTGGATASPSQPQPQVEQKPEKTEEQKSKDKQLSDMTLGVFGDDGKEKNIAQQTASYVGATLMGPAVPLSDFAVDAVNIIPGVDVPKLPKFNNSIAQATREITSVLAPTVFGGGLAAPISSAAKASKVKLLADPAVAFFGKLAFTAGVGAGVDVISETSEGDNISGMLKSNMPREFGWIPDDIATLDSDSPDVKRGKNALEGTGLGIFTDVLGAVSKALVRSKGVKSATQWLPEAETAGYFKTIAKETNETIEDIGISLNRRSEALDELGQFNISKAQQKAEPISGEEFYIEGMVSRAETMSPEDARALYQDAWNNMEPDIKAQFDELASQRTVPDIQEPMLGVHDMYGYAESGIRSVDDMGIIAARVDNARIFNNIDTVDGRLANFISEPVLKYALEGGAEYNDVIRGLGSEITAAGRYGYVTGSGKTVSADLIDKAMDDLMESAGLMSKADLEQQISKIPKRELKGEIKKTFEDLINYDQMQANALTRTSLSNQVADLSAGIRLTSGSGSIDRGLDQILDRMEMLMVADADTVTKQDVFRRMKNRLLTEDGVMDAAARNAEAIKQAKREAKIAVDSMREVKAVRPDLLEPLMLAYEASGGNVKNISALNNYFRQSTASFSKAVVDGQPEISSVVLKGFWATVYNNVLSGFGTPLKAAASNAALLIERPVAILAGSLISGDGYTYRRGMFQLQNMGESLRNSFGYMGETFRRSGLDPDYQGVVGRETMLLQDAKQMDALHSFADAAAANGDFGPQAMMQQVEAVNDLAKHPWLRFGNRAMQAFDGFTQAFIGSVESRGRAFDALAKGEITAETIEETQRNLYKSMFKPDAMGRPVITDDAVKVAAGEISLNLDNQFNNGLSEVMKRAPGLKPFMLFTKTPVNALKFGASHSPLGLFIDQFNEFGRPFNEVPIEKLESILAARGIPLDDSAEVAYNAIRAELKGRKAIGTIATMGAVGLMLNDSLTGDGIGDRQKMAFRREAGWKPRSIKLPTGQYVSYDGIPGISDWIALTANIMDNADTLSENDIGSLLNAASFVIGASITEKSGLTQVEPLFDILRLNPKAINRWATGFLPSATIPGSSQIAELTKLFAPNLKVVDDNLVTMIANRTPLKAALPDQYDWIDGGKVNEPGNLIARIFNTYSPFKVNGKISEEKQFLINIEYDNRPSMATDGRGIELTPEEQSAVYNAMGRGKYFKTELRRIMNTADGKAFRAAFRDARARGVNVRLQNFQNLHIEIDRVLKLAKEAAIAEIDIERGGAISQRRFEEKSIQLYSRQGNIDRAEEFLQETKQRGLY